jgi:hypothetical protein
MTTYTPKPTYYNGVTYRSRNEAKWARFFDHMQVRHDYEPAILSGWNGTVYRPDFYFPVEDIFGEVKSNMAGIQNEAMANKLNGAIDYQSTPVSKGLLLLGNFPYDVRADGVRLKTKWLFWHKGVCCADAYIQSFPWDYRKGTILCTKDHINAGDPLPPTASPDIFLEQDPSETHIAWAINEINKYFMEAR